MPSQMLIRISPEMKSKFVRISRIEGKNASQKIRELIEDYVQGHDIAAYAGDLWDRTQKKMSSKGKSQKNIDAAIRESRRHK